MRPRGARQSGGELAYHPEPSSDKRDGFVSFAAIRWTVGCLDSDWLYDTIETSQEWIVPREVIAFLTFAHCLTPFTDCRRP